MRRSGRILTACILAFLTVPIHAQELKIVSGEYTLTATSDMSIDQAREEAIGKARLQALADTYGTIIKTQTITTVHASQEKHTTDVRTNSFSEAYGEWIADTRAPELSILDFNLNGFTIKAKVWGRTRETVRSDVDIDARVLCGGTALSNENDTFKDGDDFYLYFKTPADGYLSVYLLEKDKVYCLLPYRSEKSGFTKVSSDREYLFFSKDKADEGTSGQVDEYQLTSDSGTAINHIYVFFSTSEFTKAADKIGDAGLHELSVDSFLRWMTKARSKDKKMQMRDFLVRIEQR